MYCMSCLTAAANSANRDDYDDYDYDDGYGYDPDDPYYSANDHDGDGKLTDEEFQDAFNDALDDLYEAGGY